MSQLLEPFAHALARTAVGPVYAAPQLPAALISQLVLGARVEVLEHAGQWLSIRTEDGYVGWTHEGYLQLGARDWAMAWERGQGGEPVVSLGAWLLDRGGRPLMHVPWGGRLVRQGDRYCLPDGRAGWLRAGEVVPVDSLAERFPPSGESVVRTAGRWVGAPYLWGGITPEGVDCSGLAQAIMWLHGIALPRDSFQQAAVGTLLPGDVLARGARAGDLLFFADRPERVSHVAISAGGTKLIHSALANGGVGVNDLAGDLEFERRLRGLLVHGRRLLPD